MRHPTMLLRLACLLLPHFSGLLPDLASSLFFVSTGFESGCTTSASSLTLSFPFAFSSVEYASIQEEIEDNSSLLVSFLPRRFCILLLNLRVDKPPPMINAAS